MDGIACPRSPIADRVGPDEAGIVRHFNEVVNALLNRRVVVDRDAVSYTHLDVYKRQGQSQGIEQIPVHTMTEPHP